MDTKIKSLFIVFLLIITCFICGCAEQKIKENDDEIIITYDSNTINSRFGFMHPDDYQDMTDLGIFWQRPHPGPFIWGEIETSPGNFDWSGTDKEVQNSQNYGVNIIATIWPFADWDQEKCHTQNTSSNQLIFPELGNYRQKPCDMDAYENFVINLVERYDGDGIDDMPGLIVPIKYWEVSNEPSMQEDWLVFFIGSAEDYLDIMYQTYQGIKNADDEAIVVQGGMAGVMEEMTKFWADVFDLGGSSYFEIANIHSINSESQAINAPEFKQFLEEEEINKSFWITEVELNFMDKETPNESNFFITSIVSAFANGAGKIFLPGMVKTKESSSENMDNKEKQYYMLKTLVEKIDYFDDVEKLADGQYKLSVEDNLVYVIWGNNNPPEEISGQIKITDIYGKESIMDIKELTSSESPVFIELIN